MGPHRFDDHYAVLGVHPDADAEQVRAAYLRLMRANHPDLRPGDVAAAETARRANLAWQTLRDSQTRAAYDRQRRARDRGSAAATADLGRPADLGQAAYVERRRAFGKDVHRACLRLGAAVFALGLLLLAFTGP